MKDHVLRDAKGAGVLVLAGGGIDSTVCMHQLRAAKRPLRAFHVDYGQPAHTQEWRAVQKQAKVLDIAATQIVLRSDHHFRPGEVVGRNAALIYLALMHLLPRERFICIGIHAGTPFADCSFAFFQGVSTSVAELTDSRVRLIAPLLELTKPEIFKLLQIDRLSITDTYSCQRGRIKPCGRCASCRDRKALEC
jgi:7-cyano-7-deazaguanine synthase